MTLFERAITFAVKAHGGATRKGSNTPYIVHPLEAAAIAATLTKEQLIIVLSDKLSNMRAIFRGCLERGDGVFEIFHVKDKAKQAWYYRGIAERLKPLKDTAAYREYVCLLEKVF